MNFFFSPNLFSDGMALELGVEESRHATRVLRLSKGQDIWLLNGMGQKANAGIIKVTPAGITVQVKAIDNHLPNTPFIAIALAALKKKERMEWFVEKAVETGVGKIILFGSHHSEGRLNDKNRLEKIAVSALKQSGNFWLPEIEILSNFRQATDYPFSGAKFIAYCAEDHKALLKNAYQPGDNALILIGPEGDFTSAETELAFQKKFVPVSLGEMRLRAETAALVSLFTFNLMNQ